MTNAARLLAATILTVGLWLVVGAPAERPSVGWLDLRGGDKNTEYDTEKGSYCNPPCIKNGLGVCKHCTVTAWVAGIKKSEVEFEQGLYLNPAKTIDCGIEYPGLCTKFNEDCQKKSSVFIGPCEKLTKPWPQGQ